MLRVGRRSKVGHRGESNKLRSDYLLARQPETSALTKANGRAFEVVSPQGDTIFVHVEENLESLEPLEKAPLVELPEDFKGLTSLMWTFLRSMWPILLRLRSSIATCQLWPTLSITRSPRKRSPSWEQGYLGIWAWSRSNWHLLSGRLERKLGETVDLCTVRELSWVPIQARSNSGLKPIKIRSIFLMKNKNGVMSVNAIIEKITEQIQEGIYQVPLCALPRWSVEWALSGLDPEKESQ